MDKNLIQKYDGKKIKIFLKNNLIFTGNFLLYEEKSGRFQAKDNEMITVDYESISLIKEVEQ